MDDGQIDSISDPSLKKMAMSCRRELSGDFGMSFYGGVDLESFAKLVREDQLKALEKEGRLSSSPKGKKPRA